MSLQPDFVIDTARVEPAAALSPSTWKCHQRRKLVPRLALPLSSRIGAVIRHALLDAVTTTPAVSIFIDSPGRMPTRVAIRRSTTGSPHPNTILS